MQEKKNYNKIKNVTNFNSISFRFTHFMFVHSLAAHFDIFVLPEKINKKEWDKILFLKEAK
jgi:hypothetical protein